MERRLRSWEGKEEVWERGSREADKAAGGYEGGEESGGGGTASEDVGPEDKSGVRLVFGVGGVGPVAGHFERGEILDSSLIDV
ncbi:hypothetical protein BPAE_0154g00150 [Botrytis paeoniae]|uniref:Uncharacterized protein n=1 Tax=Botrytis paeoniae TaxID=278948 RepID=A0A4Z1FD27_9HELO|nr:hypothetical protein BPAE_0154g00150 [Botrytis paeoniae]